jgi:hypothetical protein
VGTIAHQHKPGPADVPIGTQAFPELIRSEDVVETVETLLVAAEHGEGDRDSREQEEKAMRHTRRPSASATVSHACQSAPYAKRDVCRANTDL